MIFIVSEEHKLKDSLESISGTRSNIMRQILASTADNYILVADDLEHQIATFDYLGLKYKVVIGVPDTVTPAEFLYINDAERVIDYDSFNGYFNHEVVPKLGDESSDDY